MSKKDLIQQILFQLQQENAGILASAKAAHEAATHEESLAEDRHDTRGLEASYLAGAQASRALELQKTIALFRQTEFRDFSSTDAIAPGALVELAQGQSRTYFLLAPQGGGISLSYEGQSLHLITPQSTLGEALNGCKVGAQIEFEARGGSRHYRILSIR